MDRSSKIFLCILLFSSLILPVFALRVDSVTETSSIARLVGDSPYDIINQLDTKQLDLRAATFLSKTHLGEKDIDSKPIEKGFLDTTIKTKNWKYQDIHQYINVFTANQLFVLQSSINPISNTLYTTKDDLFPTSQMEEWRTAFSHSNPLMIMNIEGSGLILPNQPSGMSSLTRYSTIIAPKEASSAALTLALLCNLHNGERIGDIFKKARTKYYAVSDPNEQNLPGIALKSFSLYGNPLTRITVPDTYEEYITNVGTFSTFFNPCKKYYIPKDTYSFSAATTTDTTFSHTVHIDYTLDDINTYTIVNSSSFLYDSLEENIFDPYILRIHTVPKGTFIKNITPHFTNPIQLNIPNYPSFSNGTFTQRNCFERTRDAFIKEEIMEHKEITDIAIFLHPLAITNCEQGNFTLYQDIAYTIHFVSPSPFYFDTLSYPHQVLPSQKISFSSDMVYVTGDSPSGILRLMADDNIIFEKELVTKEDSLSFSFFAPSIERTTTYTLHYLEKGISTTQTSFTIQTRSFETALSIGNIQDSTVPVTLKITNYLEKQVSAQIKVQLFSGEDIYDEIVVLESGENSITFMITKATKEIQKIPFSVFITADTHRYEILDVIVTNTAPVITTKELVVKAGETVFFPTLVYDTQGDDLTITVNGKSSESWTPTEQNIGETTFTIVASDGFLSTQKEVTVTVIPSKSSVELAPFGNQVVEEGEIVSLLLYSTTQENDESLTYTLNDTRFTLVEHNWFEWQTGEGDAGIYIVGIEITKDNGEVTNVVVPIEVTHTPVAEIEIIIAEVFKSSIEKNTMGYFRFRLTNSGELDTQDVYFAFYPYGLLIPNQNISYGPFSVNKGEYISIYPEWNYTILGTFQSLFTVDPDNIIPEHDENNMQIIEVQIQ